MESKTAIQNEVEVQFILKMNNVKLRNSLNRYKSANIKLKEMLIQYKEAYDSVMEENKQLRKLLDNLSMLSEE